MGGLGRAVVWLLASTTAFGLVLYHGLKPDELLEADFAVGVCGKYGEYSSVLSRTDCDEPHDFELLGQATLPGGYVCQAKDCYYPSGDRRVSLAARAAAACQPVAETYSGRPVREVTLPVELTAYGAVSSARSAGGRPVTVWCQARALGTVDRSLRRQ